MTADASFTCDLNRGVYVPACMYVVVTAEVVSELVPQGKVAEGAALLHDRKSQAIPNTRI